MIDVYLPSNTDYVHNGNMALFCTYCDLAADLNGSWVLNFEAPITSDKRWQNVVPEAVVKVQTWQADKQLFRIDQITETDRSISATAYPIFFDSADDCFLMDVRPTDKTGQEALTIMTAGSAYTGYSDITTVKTAYFVDRNLMDAINGQDEPTFIQRWGGEIEYNNRQIRIVSRLGADNGFEIRHGKNMAGLSYQIDMAEVVTRIVPVGFNGRKIDSLTPWVDSAKINNYAVIRTRKVLYENIALDTDIEAGTDTTDMTICATQAELDAALTAAANADFAAGIDEPAVTMEIDVAIVDTIAIGAIRLGDTVYCHHGTLGISSKLRAKSIVWDCVLNRPKSIVLGTQKPSYVQDILDRIG